MTLARNALANVLQTIVGAGLLFALYRFINMSLGVAQFGVWSVVLATVSASRLADLGLSAGVTRFVARDRARDDLDRAGQVVDTAALTLVVSVGTLAPVLYPLLASLLPHLLQGEHLGQALALLPYALVSLWLSTVASVFQGGLDGSHRMDLRAGLVVSGQTVLLALTVWLVPHRGLMGLAWAQVGQGLFLIVAGRLLLLRELPALSPLPRLWRKDVLKEMLGYGAHLQLATVFMLLLDPVTKALMARFGGAAVAGYFEMANQVALKARALVVSANQAIVPHVAALAETGPEHIGRFYRRNVRSLAYFALPVFALVVAWAGALSWLLTGAYQPEFVFLLGLLTVGWAANVISVPAYFTNVGTGHVVWNTVSHALVGALNAGLGLLLGMRYGAQGVGVAYAIALASGSGLLLAMFHHRYRIGWRGESGREHLLLSVVALAVAVAGWAVPLHPSDGDPLHLSIGLLLPPLALGLAAWVHPLRRHLLESMWPG